MNFLSGPHKSWVNYQSGGSSFKESPNGLAETETRYMHSCYLKLLVKTYQGTIISKDSQVDHEFTFHVVAWDYYFLVISIGIK